ncbi:MAG: TonB-dependent receptor, partial [Acidobacteriota bacterium]|nr:TonB-dependent receptor [Acidobacteriota bacterium]
MPVSGKWTGLAVLVLWCCHPGTVQTSGPLREVRQAGVGRVVATITTLEGSVHLAGAQVELRPPGNGPVIARSLTDSTGQVTFPDVPPGLYVITTSRAGFLSRDSTVFTVRAAETARVLLDAQLTFVLPDVEVRTAMPSPTDSVQPVSMSDMLSGSIFDTAPLQGDDFQSLLPLLPGVVRDSDGRLRIKGGQPSQGALQIRSASLIDPSTGDFDLDLPAQSVQSVEVLANPFAAEYGRFSSSVTQVRTRRGTNDWEVTPGNLMPRLRGGLRRVRGFEPRLSVRGPIKRDRIFLAQDMQFRYVATPVRSLPGEPQIDLRSFDSFTRVDSVISARHTLGGGLILFPR